MNRTYKKGNMVKIKRRQNLNQKRKRIKQKPNSDLTSFPI
jgi:hypothetical protein